MFARKKVGLLYEKKNRRKIVKEKMRKFFQEEGGLTVVEYAVAGGLITLVTVGAFQALGVTVGGIITAINAILVAG